MLDPELDQFAANLNSINVQLSAALEFLNAYKSQISETNQRLNNFGNMSGSAGQQNSSTNNVGEWD